MKKVLIPIVILICSLLIVGCGSKEANLNKTSVKENTTYKITWSEKREDHELEFSPNNYEKYVAYGGNKLIFYFEDDSEFKTIIAQNGMCTITMKDESLMIISGNFVIEPVKGE